MKFDRVNVHLREDGVHIEFPAGTPAKVFVGDELQGECGIGCKGPLDIQKELKRSRAARAAVRFIDSILPTLEETKRRPDHRIKDGQRDAAFAAGFYSGLAGEFQEIDHQNNMPPDKVAPDHKLAGPTYFAGYSLGNALRRAVEISQTPLTELMGVLSEIGSSVLPGDPRKQPTVAVHEENSG